MLLSPSLSARRVGSIRRSSVNAIGAALLAGLLFGINPASAQTLSAQAAPVPTPRANSPKREILETAARNFENCAKTDRDSGKRADCFRQAQVVRKRLAEGDFQPGHRILLFVDSDTALSDTFTVRADQKLLLPNLPEISLAGVLDSELQSYLETQLARYIRNPNVRAQALWICI